MRPAEIKDVSELIGDALQVRMTKLIGYLRRQPKKVKERNIALTGGTPGFVAGVLSLWRQLQESHEGGEAPPPSWPHPPASISAAEAISVIDRFGDTLARETANDIQEAISVFVATEYRDFVRRQGKEIAQRWPWHRFVLFSRGAELPTHWGLHFALWCLSEDIGIPVEHMGTPWPSEVSPAEVAQWAARSLLQHPELDWLANDIVQCAKEGTLQSRSFRWERARLPAGGLALLYATEKIARSLGPAPFHLAPVSTDRAVRRTVSTLSGADPRKLEDGVEILKYEENDPSAPLRLEFHWEDGSQLELPYDQGTAPLLAVARKYGDAAVRHLLALYALTWSARAKADQGVWWWPQEHLSMIGLSDSKENREALSQWLKGMTRSRLIARYKTGRPLIGPLVTVGLTDGTACSLHLHPALYRGITDEEGQPRYKWWPFPLKLLQLKSDRSAGKVHILLPVLAAMWRAGLHADRGEAPPVAKVGVERLVNYLGIRRHAGRDGQERETDPRAAETLRRTLTVAQECGLIGEWHLEGGELERVTGNLIALPGQEALEILNGGELPRPAWIPATGGELKRWMLLQGKTTDQIGKQIGIPGSTLRRLTKSHDGRPLPPEVREALRLYFWRDPKDPPANK